MQLAERGVRRPFTMRADVRVGVALLAFVAAAALLIPSGPLEIDASWSELMLDLRNAGLDAIALALNAVGHGIVRALTIAGVGVFLLVARRLLELGAFAFVQSVTPFATFVIKSLVDRRRPPGQLVHPSGSSFPSGHVSYAATTATILVLLFARPPARRLGGRGARDHCDGLEPHLPAGALAERHRRGSGARRRRRPARVCIDGSRVRPQARPRRRRACST